MMESRNQNKGRTAMKTGIDVRIDFTFAGEKKKRRVESIMLWSLLNIFSEVGRSRDSDQNPTKILHQS
jgi:hypothetical protein